MDLRAEIEAKVATLAGHPSSEGIGAAVRHIVAAERWLARGRYEQDEDCFNDVIYRTNQAFEGMLKEAYGVLAGRDTSKLTPAQIEKHLTDDQVFSSRVLQLFTNYRQEWRNRSTHDHTLFFKEQEALLAIVSVSAFAAILLDQIVQAVNVERERAQLAAQRERLRSRLTKAATESLIEDVTLIVSLFAEAGGEQGDHSPAGGAALIGRLQGFIQSIAPEIQAGHAGLARVDMLQPDLVLSRGGETVILEVKSGKPSKDIIQRGHYQLISYMSHLKIGKGVLFFMPRTPEHMEVSEQHVHMGDQRFQINVVAARGA